MIKAKNADLLPDEWKKYTWNCENAIFPTVLIDDKVLWYGFPQATGTFIDGKTGFSTVFPLWIRFSGGHTLELIKSLASLDMRYQNNIEMPLTEKNVTGNSGISEYITRHETCSKCGYPMVLGKTKTGNANLLCTHCSNTELLTPASVNHYIRTNGAVCPKCGEQIYCGLSHKGLYIKCPENHWPKIEEI